MTRKGGGFDWLRTKICFGGRGIWEKFMNRKGGGWFPQVMDLHSGLSFSGSLALIKWIGFSFSFHVVSVLDGLVLSKTKNLASSLSWWCAYTNAVMWWCWQVIILLWGCVSCGHITITQLDVGVLMWHMIRKAMGMHQQCCVNRPALFDFEFSIIYEVSELTYFVFVVPHFYAFPHDDLTLPRDNSILPVLEHQVQQLLMIQGAIVGCAILLFASLCCEKSSVTILLRSLDDA